MPKALLKKRSFSIVFLIEPSYQVMEGLGVGTPLELSLIALKLEEISGSGSSFQFLMWPRKYTL